MEVVPAPPQTDAGMAMRFLGEQLAITASAENSAKTWLIVAQNLADPPKKAGLLHIRMSDMAKVMSSGPPGEKEENNSEGTPLLVE